jgi:hypothetical protein
MTAMQQSTAGSPRLGMVRGRMKRVRIPLSPPVLLLPTLSRLRFHVRFHVAGRETAAHLGGFEDRHDGLVHGIIMFGLSVAALLVIGALGSGTSGNSLNNYMSNVSPVMRWTVFGSLFLGWLGAMSGAASASMRRMKPADNVRDIRPAA